MRETLQTLRNFYLFTSRRIKRIITQKEKNLGNPTEKGLNIADTELWNSKAKGQCKIAPHVKPGLGTKYSVNKCVSLYRVLGHGVWLGWACSRLWGRSWA